MTRKPPPDGIVPIAENRRARFDYDVTDTYECGLELLGTEVKSLRQKHVHFGDAYAIVKGDELFLIGLQITPFSHGTHANHDLDRTRKLLLHRKEIDRVMKQVKERGFTLVPLAIYFKDGWAKVRIGVAKGKTHEDRREDIKKREADREAQRHIRRR